ncbi:hypothetical protein V6N13_070263 [Hibiscus sabdariffa]
MSCSSTTTIISPGQPKSKYSPFVKCSRIYVKTNVYYSQNRCLPKSRFKELYHLASSTAKGMAVEPFTSGASGRLTALFSLRALRSLLLLLNAVVLLLLLPFRGQRRVSASVSGEKVGKDEKQECGRKGWAATVVRVPSAMFHWRNVAVAVDHEAAARRSQAIRRVFQDDDDDTVREFSLFSTARGDTLFTQSWTPISVKVRGLVVLLHGLNEHSGRYTSFAKRLNANGFKVFGMDWVGHGGSDGLHAFVHSLDDAVVDLKIFLEKVLAENPGLPCFCFGHSTGGAIVLKAVLDPKVEAQVAGIILTSPAVGIQPTHPIVVALAPVISFLVPRYQITIANKKGRPVSRDPEALVAKYSDPLVYTGPLRVRTACELLRITSYLQQNVNRFTVPFLVLHGTDDTITDPQASQKLYEGAASTDKTIKLLQGLLHDLLFEPEREAIADDIIQWLNCRVLKSHVSSVHLLSRRYGPPLSRSIGDLHWGLVRAWETGGLVLLCFCVGIERKIWLTPPARNEHRVWWTVVRWFGSEIRREVSEIKDQSPFARTRYDSEFSSLLEKMTEYLALIMDTASWSLAPVISVLWDIWLIRIFSVKLIHFSHMKILMNSWHSEMNVRTRSQKQDEQGIETLWSLPSGHCCIWIVLAFGPSLTKQSDTLLFSTFYLCLPEVKSCKTVYLHHNVVICSYLAIVSSPMLGSREPFFPILFLGECTAAESIKIWIFVEVSETTFVPQGKHGSSIAVASDFEEIKADDPSKGHPQGV